MIMIVCCWLGLFQDTGEPLVIKDKTVRVDLNSLYDPCFLVHLFGELTRPGERAGLLLLLQSESCELLSWLPA